MAGTSNKNEQRRLAWEADDVELVGALERVAIPAGAKQRATARLRSENLLEPSPLVEPVHAGVAQQPSAPGGLPSMLTEASRAASQVDATQPASLAAASDAMYHRSRTGRRMSRRAMVGLGAFLAVTTACLVVYVRSLPLSQTQLTAYCTSALESLATDEPPQWQPAREVVATRLAALSGKFSQPLTLVGSVNIEMPELAKGCTVYKFAARNGTLQVYVFDYTEPRKVAGLVGQLQTLAASSTSWSLAALQTPDQLLVVATEGDLQQFFRELQLA